MPGRDARDAEALHTRARRNPHRLRGWLAVVRQAGRHARARFSLSLLERCVRLGHNRRRTYGDNRQWGGRKRQEVLFSRSRLLRVSAARFQPGAFVRRRFSCAAALSVLQQAHERAARDHWSHAADAHRTQQQQQAKRVSWHTHAHTGTPLLLHTYLPSARRPRRRELPGFVLQLYDLVGWAGSLGRDTSAPACLTSARPSRQTRG